MTIKRALVLSGAVFTVVADTEQIYAMGDTFTVDEGQVRKARVAPGTRFVEIYNEPHRHRLSGS